MIKLLISKRIEESGLKKAYIVKEMGITKNTLTNWVNGNSMIKLNQAVKLAKILNCKVDELYEWEDDE